MNNPRQKAYKVTKKKQLHGLITKEISTSGNLTKLPLCIFASHAIVLF